MHELGIVFYIIDDVKEVAINNSATSVSRVVLQLGEVSGVVPDYLQDAWIWARKREPLVQEAVLEIQKTKAATLCEACGTEYETVKHGRVCPSCGSEQTHLLCGREVMIKEIEAE